MQNYFRCQLVFNFLLLKVGLQSSDEFATKILTAVEIEQYLLLEQVLPSLGIAAKMVAVEYTTELVATGLVFRGEIDVESFVISLVLFRVDVTVTITSSKPLMSYVNLMSTLSSP